mmetsp:Transcript_895/g.1546  ORF Transcript_895/g.1546 Transcript_895/m.1546 type:complete len:356 (-) Transcript_895:98-1165(-)
MMFADKKVQSTIGLVMPLCVPDIRLKPVVFVMATRGDHYMTRKIKFLLVLLVMVIVIAHCPPLTYMVEYQTNFHGSNPSFAHSPNLLQSAVKLQDRRLVLLQHRNGVMKPMLKSQLILIYSPKRPFFYIKDMQSNEILTINSLEGFASDVTHKGDFCLPTSNKECYVFGIIDYYGDGIDVGGTDPDYCVKVNGQVVSCNTDFTGTLETVVFPEESCIQSCDPSSYSLTVTTTIASDFILIIKDESGNDIFPYTLNIASPYSTATVPVNLCRGCYQVYAENFDFATFFLVENETNDVVISKSQFPRSTSFVAFSVGGVEGCKVNTTNAAPPAREKASGIIFHVSLIMTLVMTVGVF